MRATRWFVLLVVCGLVAGPVRPADAADFVQKCNGPPVSTQSGRITLVPGLNGRRVLQKLEVRISLFECSPDRTSRGSGTFRSVFVTKKARGCGLLSQTTAFKVNGSVIWKNEATSKLAITFTVAGKADTVNVTGKVTAGRFAGHKVKAAYRFKTAASPYPTTERQACANNVKPNGRGRKSVVALNTFSTQPFVVT